MRFERVTAQGFGPLQAQALDLAPGMNIVFGPNEAGKSSWHGAIFAALCGRRRGAGLRAEDRDFRDRYQPWSGAPWAASCVIQLEDGRRIEVHQDLGNGVDCSAIDIVIGKDCSAEIMHEGAPDGSLWLGLNRDVFPAIACVRQAEIVQVLDRSASLQEHLQRAVATGGDSTAAAAIERIDSFVREQVGLDRVNSRRPLRLARVRQESARTALGAARSQHAEWLMSAAQVRELEHKAFEAELRARAAQAVEQQRRATELEQRIRKVRELLTLSGVPVARQAEYDTDVEGREASGSDREPVTPHRSSSLRPLFLSGIGVTGIAAILIGAGFPQAVLLATVGLALVFVGLRGSRVSTTKQTVGQVGFQGAVDEASRTAVVTELLGDASLEDLQADAGKVRRRAAELAKGIEPSMLLAVKNEDVVDLLTAATAARDAYSRAHGGLVEREKILPNVAEAEEEMSAATAELERVEQLAATLDVARQFLTRAQDRVHRNMAPVLADSVRRHLSALTNGRYADAVVNPETLEVRVRDAGGQFRTAGSLSHGTTEQIYMLLRIAMADHLTTRGEVTPLLLDDVTVQADPVRKRAMLDLLHTISRQRQVILFSQEAQVLQWATEALGLQDRLERLTLEGAHA